MLKCTPHTALRYFEVPWQKSQMAKNYPLPLPNDVNSTFLPWRLLSSIDGFLYSSQKKLITFRRPYHVLLAASDKPTGRSVHKTCGQQAINHWLHSDHSFLPDLPLIKSIYKSTRIWIDPRGRPTVTADSDNCFRTCCTFVRLSVRPHFSQNKTNFKRKQCLLPVRLWVWLSGSLFTPVLSVPFRSLWLLGRNILNPSSH